MHCKMFEANGLTTAPLFDCFQALTELAPGTGNGGRAFRFGGCCDGVGVVKLSRPPPRIAAPPPRLTVAPKTADPFYLSSEWRAFATAIKQQRGWVCEACDADMRSNRRALHADHIIERKDGGAEYDPANVICRCQPCHNRKTARVAAGRR